MMVRALNPDHGAKCGFQVREVVLCMIDVVVVCLQ